MCGIEQEPFEAQISRKGAFQTSQTSFGAISPTSAGAAAPHRTQCSPAPFAHHHPCAQPHSWPYRELLGHRLVLISVPPHPAGPNKPKSSTPPGQGEPLSKGLSLLLLKKRGTAPALLSFGVPLPYQS